MQITQIISPNTITRYLRDTASATFSDTQMTLLCEPSLYVDQSLGLTLNFARSEEDIIAWETTVFRRIAMFKKECTGNRRTMFTTDLAARSLSTATSIKMLVFSE